MKKAKVFLSAIAVFAIVGGALAFNSHRAQLQVYQLNGSECPFVGTYDPLVAGTPITFTNATISSEQPATADCDQTITVQAENQ